MLPLHHAPVGTGEDLVTNICLLANFATPPRADALRLSNLPAPLNDYLSMCPRHILRIIVGTGRFELPILAEYVSETYVYTSSTTCPIYSVVTDNFLAGRSEISATPPRLFLLLQKHGCGSHQSPKT